MRLPRFVLGLILAALVVAGCSGGETSDDSARSGSSDATRGEVGGNDSLRWGDGDRGVVLAHGAAFDAASWSDQAPLIADQGFTVVAVEDIRPDAIANAVQALQSEGIEDVALVGGSAGADAVLRLASDQPNLPAQLILLSPNSVVDGLGDEPKLFIASEEESVADVSTQLADAGPGSDNRAVLLPGSAHAQNIFDTDQGETVVQLILDRLSEVAAP